MIQFDSKESRNEKLGSVFFVSLHFSTSWLTESMLPVGGINTAFTFQALASSYGLPSLSAGSSSGDWEGVAGSSMVNTKKMGWLHIDAEVHGKQTRLQRAWLGKAKADILKPDKSPR